MSSSKCCGITGWVFDKRIHIAVTLVLGLIDLSLGLYSYFSSDWIKEHTISVDSGAPQTIILYKVCNHWPPNDRVTTKCPYIEFEHAFVGMLFVSLILPLIFRGLERCVEGFASAVHLVSVVINLGLIATSFLFITSARQSAEIFKTDVHVLSGPYDLQEPMKVVSGSIVISFALIKLITTCSLGIISRRKRDESQK